MQGNISSIFHTCVIVFLFSNTHVCRGANPQGGTKNSSSFHFPFCLSIYIRRICIVVAPSSLPSPPSPLVCIELSQRPAKGGGASRVQRKRRRIEGVGLQEVKFDHGSSSHNFDSSKLLVWAKNKCFLESNVYVFFQQKSVSNARFLHR